MILKPGTHVLQRAEDANRPCSIEYASVSASAPTTLQVLLGEEIIEDVHVGTYSPHTWWINNPLLGIKQVPDPSQRVTIIVGENAIFRIECHNLELVKT